jgi:lysophospholipase L1-like esterase
MLADPATLTAGTWGTWHLTAASAPGVLGPNGLASFLLTDANDAYVGTHTIAQNVVAATSALHAVSFYAKAGTVSWAAVTLDTASGPTAYAFADLLACSAGTLGAGNASFAVEPAGNGWCRVSLVRSLAAGAHSVAIALAYADGSSGLSGDGTHALYVTMPQLEPFAYSTTYTATTRGAPSLPRVANPRAGSSSPWTASAIVRAGLARQWGLDARAILAGGTFGAPSSFVLYETAGGFRLNLWDASGVLKSWIAPAAGLTAGSEHRIAVTYGAGSVAIYLDGAPLAATTSGTGTGILPRVPSWLYIGNVSDGSSPFGGTIRDVRVASTINPAKCDGALGVARAFPYGVTALGDSITYGQFTTTSYPLTLAARLGGAWQTRNMGVSGSNTTSMLSRWQATGRVWETGTLVVLGGINDIIGNGVAATIFGRLQTIYEEAMSDGRRVIALTVLPWNGSVNYTADRETQRLALNVLILSYCATNGITCIDTSTLFDDGAGALKAGYDSGDHIHPSQAGANYLAALVQAALAN